MFGQNKKKKYTKAEDPERSTNGLAKKSNPDFTPKASLHVTKDAVSADNDKWIEKLAVVEVDSRSSRKEPIPQIRSYFESESSKKRSWDEPPSGASDIQYATPEMHEMAKMQLQEILMDKKQLAAAVGSYRDSEKSKKKGFGALGLLRKKSKSSVKTGHATQQGTKDVKPPIRERYDETYDPDIQMALAMSMVADGTPITPANPSYVPHGVSDDAIAMAKAMSLSENEASEKKRLQRHYEEMDEEEVLRKVMEQSRIDAENSDPFQVQSGNTESTYNTGGAAAAAAATPNETLFDFEDYDHKEAKNVSSSLDIFNEDLDKKMPAKVSSNVIHNNERDHITQNGDANLINLDDFDPFSTASSVGAGDTQPSQKIPTQIERDKERNLKNVITPVRNDEPDSDTLEFV